MRGETFDIRESGRRKFQPQMRSEFWCRNSTQPVKQAAVAHRPRCEFLNNNPPTIFDSVLFFVYAPVHMCVRRRRRQIHKMPKCWSNKERRRVNLPALKQLFVSRWIGWDPWCEGRHWWVTWVDLNAKRLICDPFPPLFVSILIRLQRWNFPLPLSGFRRPIAEGLESQWDHLSVPVRVCLRNLELFEGYKYWLNRTMRVILRGVEISFWLCRLS